MRSAGPTEEIHFHVGDVYSRPLRRSPKKRRRNSPVPGCHRSRGPPPGPEDIDAASAFCIIEYRAFWDIPGELADAKPAWSSSPKRPRPHEAHA